MTSNFNVLTVGGAVPNQQLERRRLQRQLYPHIRGAGNRHWQWLLDQFTERPSSTQLATLSTRQLEAKLLSQLTGAPVKVSTSAMDLAWLDLLERQFGSGSLEDLKYRFWTEGNGKFSLPDTPELAGQPEQQETSATPPWLS